MSYPRHTGEQVPASPRFPEVEERVQQINETNPMRDTDVARVRSVSAVRWAMQATRALTHSPRTSQALVALHITAITFAIARWSGATRLSSRCHG